MKFTKMQGLGNDYVYVNCFQEQVDDPSEFAVRISDRHFGVGSDGLILIRPSDRADFEMAMYNADGSRGEMCGNGIRCVGKYVYDYGLTGKTEITVETLGGIKHLNLAVADGKVNLVRVDMGSPVLEPEKIPVKMDGNRAVGVTLGACGREYRMTCVSMGNPHAVIFMEEDIGELPLKTIGPLFENHERFPNRVNTEFVNVLDRRTVRMRVWERGSGETLACGTGACAAAVASVLGGLTENELTVKLLGGDLQIEWDRNTDTVYMTGPAVTVFEGEWPC